MIDYRQKIREASDDIIKAYWVGRLREFEDWKLFSEEKPTEAKEYLVITKTGTILLLPFYTKTGLFNDNGSALGTAINVEAWKEVI